MTNISPSHFQLPHTLYSVVLSLPMVGSHLGSVLANYLGGWLCAHGFAGGWPSVFYLSGLLCLVVGLLCFILVRNHPSDHPLVSPEECAYIADHIARSGKDLKTSTNR